MKICEIEIGSGILKDMQKLIQCGSVFAIITDDIVASLYGNTLQQSLLKKGVLSFLFSFPSGETHKTRQIKEQLENQLFEKGLGKDTCIIALGGGVATDMAGFIAATYCRGVSFLMIPTSLLGMVDACIGGKTGVNVPYGKNLLGCIYQPKKVLIDVSALKTLPQKEWVNGFVEMIKHGLVADRYFFADLEKKSGLLFSSDPLELQGAIFKSCSIKKAIVEEDEKEQGKRRLLNFGHTIGHALETITHYSLAHGEAVAIGILVESYLSMQLGYLKQDSLEKIHRALLAYGASLQIPQEISLEEMLALMKLDKKSLKKTPRFVLLEEIGTPLSFGGEYCDFVSEDLIKNALEWMSYDLCCH